MGDEPIVFSPDLAGAEYGLRLRALVDVMPRQVKWLVPGMIPLRTLTLVAGVGGLGKSTWLAAIAAQVSSGKLGGPADVIFVSLEDPAAEVMRPRVEAAGATWPVCMSSSSVTATRRCGSRPTRRTWRGSCVSARRGS